MSNKKAKYSGWDDMREEDGVGEPDVRRKDGEKTDDGDVFEDGEKTEFSDDDDIESEWEE